LQIGEAFVPGHSSNYHSGRASNNVYFGGLIEPAVWGAEVATALSGTDGLGHVHLVEPLGVFEDEPNLTDKKFPGSPTQSYRSPCASSLRSVTGWATILTSWPRCSSR
jgi:rifampin ADP-ribosylating transferase